MKLLVLGLGYVGTANAILAVTTIMKLFALILIIIVVNLINDKKSPIEDKEGSRIPFRKKIKS